MSRSGNLIAELNEPVHCAGMDVAVPVSSKTKAKTTTKTV